MMKILLFLAFIILATANLRGFQHDYWYSKGRVTASTAGGGVLSLDKLWNYCDYKCLYLENYYDNTDFVVLYFNGGTVKPNFAACYIKTGQNSYKLWNTVAKNTWYDKNCGEDSEDWVAKNYKIDDKDGQGIGAPLKNPY